jgi:putative membrane protein
MIIQKNLTFKRVMQFTGQHLIWIIPWASSVVFLFEYAHLTWLSIPWLPLSLIGTAVAFYIGFKNNSAYDRMWEARKIWG